MLIIMCMQWKEISVVPENCIHRDYIQTGHEKHVWNTARSVPETDCGLYNIPLDIP